VRPLGGAGCGGGTVGSGARLQTRPRAYLTDLDSSSVLDLKHMAFPDHSLDLNMQFLNSTACATLKSLTSSKTLACTLLNSIYLSVYLSIYLSSCKLQSEVIPGSGCPAGGSITAAGSATGATACAASGFTAGGPWH